MENKPATNIQPINLEEAQTRAQLQPLINIAIERKIAQTYLEIDQTNVCYHCYKKNQQLNNYSDLIYHSNPKTKNLR
jgi:hypothetical protein